MGTSKEIEREARHQVYREHLIEYYHQQIKNRSGRKWEYITTYPMRVGIVVGIGTTTGLTTGIIGGVSYQWITVGTEENSASITCGATIGAMIGGAIGCMIALGIVYYEYEQWLKTEEGKLFAAQITGFLVAGLALKDLVCNLTNEIVLNPVRSPYGYVYDREAIEKWIRKHATDPVTNKPLKIEELSPARDIYIKLAKEIAKILEEDSETLVGADQGFVDGLNALRKGIEEQRDEEYNKEFMELRTQKRVGEVTSKQFSDRLKKLNEIYYL